MKFSFSQITIKFEGEPAAGKSHLMEIVKRKLEEVRVTVRYGEPGEHVLIIPTQVTEE